MPYIQTLQEKKSYCKKSVRPLQQTATSKAWVARCCTPAFPYQCHFDWYVEALEEDATLFWEGDPESGLESQNERGDSTQCPGTPPSSEGESSEIVVLSPPALTIDIHVP